MPPFWGVAPGSLVEGTAVLGSANRECLRKTYRPSKTLERNRMPTASEVVTECPLGEGREELGATEWRAFEEPAQTYT